jgi:hypothetical protein
LAARRDGIVLENDISEYNLSCPFCRRFIAKVRSHEDQSPHRGDYLFCPCGNVGVLADRKSHWWGWHVRKPTPAERVRIASLYGYRSGIDHH